MYQPKLFFFVEGKWDKAFVEKILKWRIYSLERYQDIQIHEYSNDAKASIKVASVVTNNDIVFFLRDRDRKDCITRRKADTYNQYGLAATVSVCIVVEKIESWYEAGLTEKTARELGFENWLIDRPLSKIDFRTVRPKQYNSEADFRQAMLKKFSFETALEQSPSFHYLAQKIGLVV
jgi:hypothetical protein